MSAAYNPETDDSQVVHPERGTAWIELLGILGLLVLTGLFLHVSWRRWPDPIVDFGPQCYAAWRLAEGGLLYHDFVWNYGPFSIQVYSLLFRLFSPGIMVLATANLVVYFAIASVAYVAFRKAWGRVAAITALAVFISVFSFSHLLGVGNYNYVTPYSVESIHGMLLLLVAILIASKLHDKPCARKSFFLGLVFGFTVVIKPEFMLATAALSGAVLVMRKLQSKSVRGTEIVMFALGGVLPMLCFSLWFARSVGLTQGFIDANQAWWLVLVDHVQSGSMQQARFAGGDALMENLGAEVMATLAAFGVFGVVIIFARMCDKATQVWLKIALSSACASLIIFAGSRFNGWLGVGLCFPGLIGLLIGWKLWHLHGVYRKQGRLGEANVTGFMILLASGAMLARMVLHARIYHFGYFQAALAGMALSAIMVSELPRLAGNSRSRRILSVIFSSLVLLMACHAIVARNLEIRADQTELVGEGMDRFYATVRNLDTTGALVNFAAEKLRETPVESRVMVFPEGLMVNYLARRRSLEPGWMRGMTELQFKARFEESMPDYVVFITRDIHEFGFKKFGTPGELGFEIVKSVATNYVVDAGWGGDPLSEKSGPGVLILKKRNNEFAKPLVNN